MQNYKKNRESILWTNILFSCEQNRPLSYTFGLLSNGFDLLPEYSQRGICTNRFRQFLVCPDGHSQFRVQFIEHDCGHFMLVCNRFQPPVFFPIFMLLYPTDNKQDKENKRTAYTCPNIRILVPAIRYFAP